MPEEIISTGAAAATGRIDARRSIVIGLGGTGRHVCTHLKRILLENHENDPSRFPYVKILSIDSDKRVKEVLQEQTGEFMRLDKSELLGMQIPDETHDNMGQFISPDLKRSLKLANDHGAGARRPIGHAFLVTNWHTIRDRISKLHQELMRPEIRTLMASDPRFRNMNSDSDRVDIYVVGNLVSGTGSGMALGMGYLLRDLIAGWTGGRSQNTLEGVFTVCGTYNQPDRQGRPSMYAVNCYAALLELNHYFTPANYSNPNNQYQPGYARIEIQEEALGQSPYDYVQLLCPSHMGGGDARDDQLDPIIASVLALRTGSEAGMTMYSKIVDRLSHQPPADAEGRVSFCYAWGGISFRSSAKDVLDLATAIVADQTLDALAGPFIGNTDPKSRAQNISVAVGFGFGQQNQGPARGKDLLMKLMITQKELSIERMVVSSGLNLTEALPRVISSLYPMPSDDRGETEGMPARLDRSEVNFNTLTNLIDTVISGNRERLTPLLHEQIEKELYQVADFAVDGTGSLDSAVKTIDHLTKPGAWLQQDSDAYRTKATEFEKRLDQKWKTYRLCKDEVIKLATAGRFNYPALQSSWTDMVKAIEDYFITKAQRVALSAARIMLDGDLTIKSDDERVRSGLVKCLEALQRKFVKARDEIDKMERLFENRAHQLRTRLDDPAQRNTVSEQAMRYKEEFLKDDRARAVARAVVNEMGGAPWQAATRYMDAVQFNRDFAVVDQTIRSLLQEYFSMDITQSIAANPTFDRKLDSLIDQSVPAIRLDATAGNVGELAFISHPPRVQPFVDAVTQTNWYQRPKLIRDQEVFHERSEDDEPRIDVVTATELFSPANVLAVRNWAGSYARETLMPGKARDVHTLPGYGSHTGLLFEGLARDDEYVRASYFIARCLQWLVDQGGQVLFKTVREQKVTGLSSEQEILLSGRLGEQSFFTSIFCQQYDLNHPAPLVQVEKRFKATMDSGSEQDKGRVIDMLAVGFAQLAKRSGDLADDPLLPEPRNERRFTPFASSVERIIRQDEMVEILRDRTDYYGSLPKVPSLGEIHMEPPCPPTPPGPPPKPVRLGQERGWYCSFSPATGACSEPFSKDDDRPLPPGHYRYYLQDKNDWSEPFEVTAAAAPPAPPPPLPPRAGQ